VIYVKKRTPLWPDPRVKPPFGAAEIDWGHPLARGLRVASIVFDGTQPIPNDLVRTDPWGTGGTDPIPALSRYGQTAFANNDATAFLNRSTDPWLTASTTQPISVFTVYQPVDDNNDRHIFNLQAGQRDFAAVNAWNSNNTLVGIVDSGFTGYSVSLGDIGTSSMRAVGGSWGAAGLKGYLDGVLKGTNTNPTAHRPWATGKDFRWLSSGVGADRPQGRSLLIYAWDRQLTDSEQLQLGTGEFYAFLRPVVRRKYSIPAQVTIAGGHRRFTSALWPDKHQQPRYGTAELDRSHPLMRGIHRVWMYLPGDVPFGRDYAENGSVTHSGGQPVYPYVTQVGVGLRIVADTSGQINVSQNISPTTTSPYSHAMYGLPYNSGAVWHEVSGLYGGRATRFIAAGSALDARMADYPAQVEVLSIQLTPSLALNVPHQPGLSWAAGTARGYFDGALIATDTTSLPTSHHLTGGLTNCAIMSQYGATRNTPYWLLMWHREVAAEEFRWLWNEPYAFLRPIIRRRYSIPGAAAPTFQPSWAARSNILIGVH